MDHHRVDAHQPQQDNVADDRLAQLVGNHGVAAVFDDDRLAVVPLDVGQRLHQHLRPVAVIEVHIHVLLMGQLFIFVSFCSGGYYPPAPQGRSA